MIGQTLSHYLIEKRLGAGGMGEVFLARDLALGRSAAVKVLAQAVDQELQSRLRREAEACARLQHPAIATFYEAGEAAGSVFLAMEFVAGETLRQRLERGPLSLPHAIAVTACLLEALNHAHAAGVLHRDIKPENIMVTADGLAKLLDFGIARLLGPQESDGEARTATALTQAGAVIGTIGYMSPEQLKGQALDERSDLFSLGAVLYEMLSGKEAFPGASAAEVIASVLAAGPTPRVDTGGHNLNAVLEHALARDPSRRYPSAAAFLADLRAAASGEFVAVLPDTLAVVDFENLSRDPGDDWIGSGIAESLSADLMRVPGLSVVAREKLLQTRARLEPAEKETEAVSLGRLLACRWVLSGGYQRVGPRLRVTSRLTDVATGETVAREKLDGTVDGIFGMQDALAAAMLETLRPGGSAPAATTTPPPIDAFERHARGRRLFLQLEKGSLDQARAFYEQAIGAEPEYAPALAGLSAVHAMRFTFMTDASELETASGYARRAIAANAELAEPRVWLGYALFRQGRPDEAVEQEQRAIELDPANVYAPYFAGCALGMFGRREAAVPYFQRTLEIEPRHIWAWLALGWMHLELGSGSEAVWCLEKAVALERLQGAHRTAGVAGFLGECLRRLGETDDARARCLEGLEAVERSDNMYRDTFRGVCLCALGRAARAQGDAAAAHAAFTQAVTHLRGRPRTLGGGQLMVQALAGLAQTDGEKLLEEALDLFTRREGHDFSLMWSCTDDPSLLELSRAARALGRRSQAGELRERAVAAGSREASDAGPV